MNYSVFIVRCWQDARGFRFRIEDPHSGEQELFDGLEDLITHLRERYGSAENQIDDEGESNASFLK